MPGILFDTSVWLAAIFPAHPFHVAARQCVLRATASEPAVFCRATQQSFLRLASTPAILKAYGASELTNRDATMALEALMALPQVREFDEPAGTFALWKRMASLGTASPKVWMDAYLAAFAIGGGLRMTTLDQDFRNFVSQGLKLELITGS